MTIDLPAETQNDYLIPVAFDLVAPTREAAVRILHEVLDECHDRLLHTYPDAVESWWFAEADDKVVDGNDRPAMHLVHSQVGSLSEVATAIAGSAYDPTISMPAVVLDVDDHRIQVTDWNMDDPEMNFVVTLYTLEGHQDADMAIEYVEVRSAHEAVDAAKGFAADVRRSANVTTASSR